MRVMSICICNFKNSFWKYSAKLNLETVNEHNRYTKTSNLKWHKHSHDTGVHTIVFCILFRIWFLYN